MLEYLTIFGAGFISVFALGFNSRNVNNGDYTWAAGTSFFIGLSQASLWATITAPDVNTWIGGFVYGSSGALAITASMYTHQRFVKKEKNG